jgi:hypothetical protein
MAKRAGKTKQAPIERPEVGTFARDFATTVMALVDAGRVGQADEAFVGLGAHLASLLDRFPNGAKGLELDKLAHQYRMVVVRLHGDEDDDDGDSSDTLDLIERLEQAVAEGRGKT